MYLSDATISRKIHSQQKIATRLAFFVAGLAVAVWGPLIPYVRERTGMDEAMLGMLLLSLGAGAMTSMSIAGGLAARYGCRPVLISGAVLICAMLPFLATSTNLWVIFSTLFVFGVGMGVFDCVMNIQAVVVERNAGEAQMSGFHGMYSVGGIVGAGGMALMLTLGASPLVAVTVMMALIGVLLYLSRNGMLGKSVLGSGTKESMLAIPRGMVLFLGGLCFILFLSEGSVLDWSAEFLTSVRGSNPAHAGLGFAAFAAAMTLGRLTGDRVVTALGPVKVVLFGAALAAAGFVLVVLGGTFTMSVIGFAITGLGCSNIVPVLFTAVGRQKSMPEHLAVPAMAMMGYTGGLAGPAGIGFIAHGFGLELALLILAGMLALVTVGSRWLKV